MKCLIIIIIFYNFPFATQKASHRKHQEGMTVLLCRFKRSMCEWLVVVPSQGKL